MKSINYHMDRPRRSIVAGLASIARGRRALWVGGAAMASLVIASILLAFNGSNSGATGIPGLAGLTPTKNAALQEQIVSQEKQGSVHPAPVESVSQGEAQATQRATPAAQLPFPTGIQDIKQAPFGPDQFIVSNEWTTVIGGTQYVVYCGATSTGASEGVATAAVEVSQNVISGYSNQPKIDGVFKYDPAGSQILTAASANGAIVTLSYPGGTVDFNLSNDAFVPAS